MATNHKEFSVSDIEKFPILGTLKKLAEGAVQLSVKGFPPKRMDKYVVEACENLIGNWMVILILENSNTRLTKFTYMYFQKDSTVWMGISDELITAKLSNEEFFKALPIS